jgi:hypothetical protein
VNARPARNRFPIQLTGARVDGTGAVVASVQAQAPATVRISFFGASGLDIVPSTMLVKVGPEARTVARATVRTVGVSPGSQLPVFAVAEFDDAEGHHAEVAAALIEIAAPSPLAERTLQWLGLATLTLLASGWIVVAAIGKRRRV